MFRPSQRSSSGDQIALIHHLVWSVCVSDCLVCWSGGNSDPCRVLASGASFVHQVGYYQGFVTRRMVNKIQNTKRSWLSWSQWLTWADWLAMLRMMGISSSWNLSGHSIRVTSPKCRASVAVSFRHPNSSSLVWMKEQHVTYINQQNIKIWPNTEV